MSYPNERHSKLSHYYRKAFSSCLEFVFVGVVLGDTSSTINQSTMLTMTSQQRQWWVKYLLIPNTTILYKMILTGKTHHS